MANKAKGNQYRDTRVCINSYEGRSFVGIISNPWYEEAVSFDGTMDFLTHMQNMLEDMHFPMPERVLRGFEAEKPNPTARPAPSGQLATFNIQILFLQKASWQGLLKWKEGGKESTFRSALELLFLMDSACRESAEALD